MSDGDGKEEKEKIDETTKYHNGCGWLGGVTHGLKGELAGDGRSPR